MSESKSEYALLARFEAAAGEEAALADFLTASLEAAREEPGMTTWFALRFDESSFGIFDTFPDQTGRQAHLEGEIAQALLADEDDLLADEPTIERVDVLAAMHAD
ncbi:putative quinol monooxygenase [Halosegnis sp.]|uniref:putative quinol monooxygenase n=1 Tax=Halosegnis sp. TaxID=2864959 RepID=UPI0035D3E935